MFTSIQSKYQCAIYLLLFVRCHYISLFKYIVYIFSGAQGCVLAFSTVDHASYTAVQRWRGKVSTFSRNHKIIIIYHAYFYQQ